MRYRPNAGEIVLRIVCNKRIGKLFYQRLTIYTVQSLFGFGCPAPLIQPEKNAISRAECVTGKMQAKLCLESSVMNESGNFLSTPFYLHCTITFWFWLPCTSYTA